MQLVISDLDGTISDHRHRLGIINRDVLGNTDWERFHAECIHDLPIASTIRLLQGLDFFGHQIDILTGRSEATRAETEAWLNEHGVPYTNLRMRPNDNHTQGHILKRQWLIEHYSLSEIFCVFEDAAPIVNMWRDHGLQCFQVQESEI